MSKLGVQLRIIDREGRVMRPMRFTRVDEKIDTTAAFMDRYRIGATFMSSVTYDQNVDPVPHIINRAKLAILEEVFGEYRAPLFEAVRLLDNYEVDKARLLIMSVLANFTATEPMEQP